MSGIEAIAEERCRQITVKGFDDIHDDDGSWPTELAAHVLKKYHGDRRKILVIAGALIAAEIERIDRASSATHGV